jgi:hypothetical protein
LQLAVSISIFLLASVLGCTSYYPPISAVSPTIITEEQGKLSSSGVPQADLWWESDLLSLPVEVAATGSFVALSDGRLGFRYTSAFKHKAGTSVNWVVPHNSKESVLVVQEIIAPTSALWSPGCVVQNDGLSAMWMNEVVPVNGMILGGFDLNRSHPAGMYTLNITVDGSPVKSLSFYVGDGAHAVNTINMTKAAEIIKRCQEGASAEVGWTQKCSNWSATDFQLGGLAQLPSKGYLRTKFTKRAARAKRVRRGVNR